MDFFLFLWCECRKMDFSSYGFIEKGKGRMRFRVANCGVLHETFFGGGAINHSKTRFPIVVFSSGLLLFFVSR